MKLMAILGIDIAKTKFDVCLQLAQGGLRRHSFPNNTEGFVQLRHWLQVHQAGPLRVGIEATGCYWVSLAHELHAQAAVVHLLNPAYVKAPAQSQGRRSKTDRVDAQIIADYVATHACEPWAPLPAELEELRELMRLYADVTAVAASVGQRQEALRTATRPASSWPRSPPPSKSSLAECLKRREPMPASMPLWLVRWNVWKPSRALVQ